MNQVSSNKRAREDDDDVKTRQLYPLSWQCPICFDVLGQDAGLVPCVIVTCTPHGHLICAACATRIIDDTKKPLRCPMCRELCGGILPIPSLVNAEVDPRVSETLAAFEAARRVRYKPTSLAPPPPSSFVIVSNNNQQGESPPRMQSGRQRYQHERQNRRELSYDEQLRRALALNPYTIPDELLLLGHNGQRDARIAVALHLARQHLTPAAVAALQPGARMSFSAVPGTVPNWETTVIRKAVPRRNYSSDVANQDLVRVATMALQVVRQAYPQLQIDVQPNQTADGTPGCRTRVYMAFSASMPQVLPVLPVLIPVQQQQVIPS